MNFISFNDDRDLYAIKIVGLNSSVCENDLEKYFSDYDEPIIIDINNGIILYESLDECVKNKDKMNGKKIKGKKISITVLCK